MMAQVIAPSTQRNNIHRLRIIVMMVNFSFHTTISTWLCRDGGKLVSGDRLVDGISSSYPFASTFSIALLNAFALFTVFIFLPGYMPFLALIIAATGCTTSIRSIIRPCRFSSFCSSTIPGLTEFTPCLSSIFRCFAAVEVRQWFSCPAFGTLFSIRHDIPPNKGALSLLADRCWTIRALATIGHKNKTAISMLDCPAH